MITQQRTVNLEEGIVSIRWNAINHGPRLMHSEAVLNVLAFADSET